MTRYPTRWVVIVLALAGSLAFALSRVGLGDRFDRDTTPIGVAPSSASHQHVPSAADETAAAGWAPVSAPAAAILRQWDRKRSRAYARADADALSALYAGGSRAGTSDVGLLQGYMRRGLRVEGLRMQLLAVEVLAKAPGRWRVRVTDRVHGGVAVGVGTRVILPRDEATTRVVTLRRRSPDADWKVAAVRG